MNHDSSKPGNAAWNEDRYEQLQLLLEDEFVLSERYDEMERKLSFVTQLIKSVCSVSIRLLILDVSCSAGNAFR